MSYPERHFASTEQILARTSLLTPDHVEHLREHGYCIIENVVTAEKCKQVRNHFHQFLMDLGTDITPDQLASGRVASAQLPYNLHGIIEYPRMVGPEVLKIRFDERVGNIFSTLWNVDAKDLITSKDRACYMPKAKENATSSYRPWLHVDQPHVMSGLQCVQGLVTVCDVSEQGGSLVVVPGSHKHHAYLTETAEKEMLQRKTNQSVCTPTMII